MWHITIFHWRIKCNDFMLHFQTTMYNHLLFTCAHLNDKDVLLHSFSLTKNNTLLHILFFSKCTYEVCGE